MLSHSSLGPAHLLLHKAQKQVSALFSLLSDWAAFIGAVLILGLASSWYMIDSGTLLTTEREGPWVSWTSAGRLDADPYTRAHFARLGTLELTTEIARSYVAYTDSDGGKLHSSCDYLVEGREPGTSWWSITVFDDKGELIANPVKRYAFTSQSIAIRPDGTFAVTLSREATPGNWLPTGGAGRLALVFTTLDARAPLITAQDGNETALPEIRLVKCR